jgi:glycosyltransferase involved in cell wall biosynthesis
MSTPKITIITPSYNQAEFISQTIDSVLSQNYSNLEYIIIDGGSTDGSVDIIKRHQKYLSYWTSEKDDGQSHAINKGLKIATGEIVNWLNSDDYLEPHALNVVADAFSNNTINAVAAIGNVVRDRNMQMTWLRHLASRESINLRPFFEKVFLMGLAL